jgi:hypothetical protein
MSIITKKPKAGTKLSDRDIDALIAKGGDVPAEIKKENERRSNKGNSHKKASVQLRLPQNLIDRIDDILDKRIITTSRHTWFLEAIEAKIKADEENQ